ncbi:hypothetical protein AKJ52_01710 [candidate division MSBL1 archaeon SCGC-AAA382C18]|uniref:histidine kinase n=1 Tax=candidate division MSBL1 archaeon SCGC-AAA382C18 TaxID=1698281 RepID=A0A133VJX8_9EURY|nr:hypothetical protein AKJ52_01710 [candidate division MSBL1 archaeon SCGC-AAA382C18]
MEELFFDLVENSVEHSECSKIKFTTNQRDNKAIVRVEDNGKGLPDHMEENPFERGVKGEKSSGTGLGTHLAFKAAQTYNGDIEIGDSDLGEACFNVKLNLINGEDTSEKNSS